MKVLDLQCGHGHAFEGWFASEEDFTDQCQRALITCPACGSPTITKKLSAPRLSLARSVRPTPNEEVPVVAAPAPDDPGLMRAWLEVARQVVANTSDVGGRFAEEARKMHYQETEARAIRGTATSAEARSLIEEGIEVLPFVLPESFKETLQ
jgi:hypothetical protein